MDFELDNMSGGLLPIPYIGFYTHMNLACITVTSRSATTSSRGHDCPWHLTPYVNKRVILHHKRCLGPVRQRRTDNKALVGHCIYPIVVVAMAVASGMRHADFCRQGSAPGHRWAGGIG